MARKPKLFVMTIKSKALLLLVTVSVVVFFVWWQAFGEGAVELVDAVEVTPTRKPASSPAGASSPFASTGSVELPMVSEKPIDEEEPYIVDCSKALEALAQRLGPPIDLDDIVIPDDLSEALQSMSDAERTKALRDLRRKQDKREHQAQVGKLFEAIGGDDSVSAEITRAMLLNRDSSAQLSHAQAAISQQPDSELAYTVLLNACLLQQELCVDLEEDIIESATRVGGNNGYLWFLVASMHIKNEDVEAALHAMQQAAFTPVYNMHRLGAIDAFTEMIPFSTLSELNDPVGIPASLLPESMHRPAEAMHALGYVEAQALFGHSETTDFCKTQGLERADIATACLDLGKQMQRKGMTDYTNSMGHSLQQTAYEVMGDDVSVDAVRQERERLHEESSALLRSMGEFSLSLFEARLWDVAFEQERLYGQRQGRRAMFDEAVRLSADPDYNPCPI